MLGIRGSRWPPKANTNQINAKATQPMRRELCKAKEISQCKKLQTTQSTTRRHRCTKNRQPTATRHGHTNNTHTHNNHATSKTIATFPKLWQNRGWRLWSGFFGQDRLAWDLSLRNFGSISLAWERSLGKIRLEAFAWDLSLGSDRFGMTTEDHLP